MNPALVLGSAACLWSDLEQLPAEFVDRATVVAVNAAGCMYPHRIDHWATLHPENLHVWARERTRRGGNEDYQTWTRIGAHPDCDWAIGDWGGSSGLFGVRVAIELHCRPIVLAGIPMDGSAHITGGQGWSEHRLFRQAWLRMQHELTGRVFSMSGWTREQLGYPTKLLQSGIMPS